ncbi:putative alanine and arginine rich protein [Rosellinia necatrix]|uniref:Putative alanine and arginine rich protein n=1 Tax=Rosellinia necatrix TaxID=77044 RepID=A0A1W2TNL7_ROSNE|nr:putative alanine and arginine rich protein [Rosellinia necatrix]
MMFSHTSMSALPTSSAIEPVVRASSPMPPGYTFVPKGDPYLTRHCRRQTQEAHQVVYVVVDDKKKQIGIRVPIHIQASVKRSEIETRSTRKQLVRKSDESLEKHFREAILARFPRIPHDELPKIIHRATAKGKGRVGRTGTIGMDGKVRLAVQAHIRHTKTDYDGLLRNGTEREEARRLTLQKALDILKEWGPIPKKKQTPERTRKQTPAKPAQKTEDETAASKAVVPTNAAAEAGRQDDNTPTTTDTETEIMDEPQPKRKLKASSPDKAARQVKFASPLATAISVEAVVRQSKQATRQQAKRQRHNGKRHRAKSRLAQKRKAAQA